MDDGFNFRLFGFPVQVQPAFLLLGGIVLVFGLQAQTPMSLIGAFVAVIFVSILVHELGHAFVSRWFGLDVKGIFIHGFGGHVTHAPGTVGQQLAISLAGPVAGLALGGVCMGLVMVTQDPWVLDVLVQAAFVNVFWSLFNLLPIYPMDGGNALMAGLHFVVAPRTAMLVTFGLGSVVGGLVAVAGWQYGFLFVTLFAASFTFQNVQLFRRIHGVTGAAEG